MVMTKKDVEEYEKMISKLENEKGPNDLEMQIEYHKSMNKILQNKILDSHNKIKELEKIEGVHRKINGDLRKEVYDWKMKAAKADEYKSTIEQQRMIISDLSIANQKKK